MSYDGDFLVALTGDQVAILAADPQILIAGEVFEMLLRGYGEGPTTLDLRAAGPPGQAGRFTGAVLTLDGVNRRVVYRIGRYRPDRNQYEAEWPD